MTMYKLMTSDGNCISIHTKDLTIEEANTMRDHYDEFYPNQIWWIMPHDESDYYNEEPRRYSTNAVDGWEDLFDH
jgi:hypothetical protein